MYINIKKPLKNWQKLSFATPVLWDLHLNFRSELIKRNLERHNWKRMRKKRSKAFVHFCVVFWYLYISPLKKNGFRMFYIYIYYEKKFFTNLNWTLKRFIMERSSRNLGITLPFSLYRLWNAAWVRGEDHTKRYYIKNYTTMITYYVVVAILVQNW